MRVLFHLAAKRQSLLKPRRQEVLHRFPAANYNNTAGANRPAAALSSCAVLENIFVHETIFANHNNGEM